MSEFTTTFNRDEFRPAVPSPRNTFIHRCGPTPGAQAQANGEHCEISLVGWSSVTFVGTMDELRAALDQLELAYDRLVNPPEVQEYAQGRGPQLMEVGPS